MVIRFKIIKVRWPWIGFLYLPDGYYNSAALAIRIGPFGIVFLK